MRILNRKTIGALGVLLILLVMVTIGFMVLKGRQQKVDTSSDRQVASQVDSAAQDIQPKEVASGLTITSGESEFGTMLFSDKGQAIYIWELEGSAEAKCYGDCAEAWPPVLTDGVPVAKGSVDSELLGTIKRTDGSTQVTYNGHPLYYYAHESAGEVKCHNISTHGGLWWVIQPNGNRAA